MENKLYAIRGAINATNTHESILDAVRTLFQLVSDKNDLHDDDIVSIQFSCTKDLTALNPAAALRKAGFAATVPLFCAQEPDVEGSLPCMIRLMITTYLGKKPQHCYLGEAVQLRPEFAQK